MYFEFQEQKYPKSIQNKKLSISNSYSVSETSHSNFFSYELISDENHFL